MSMNRLWHCGSAVLVSALSLTTLGVAQAADGLAEAIANGKTSIQLRARFEAVEDERFDNDANATTLRTRLSYSTDSYANFKGFIQFDNLTSLADSEYSAPPDEADPDYPVIADPSYTEVNQAYLVYGAPAKTDIKFGRQLILLDNQRFVGGVGWRQNEVTFDGLSVTNKAVENLSLFGAYLYNRNFLNNTDDDVRRLLLNAKYGFGAYGAISAYTYMYESLEDTTNGITTYGLRYNGAVPLSEGQKVLLEAEYASQTDNDDDAQSFSASYLHLAGGFKMNDIVLKAGYEDIGSDDGDAGFRFDLGTNHKFNGWADQFLATPDAGLTDTYLMVKAKVVGFGVTAFYHRFSESDGDEDFGSEIDIAISKKLGKNYTLLIKYADFSAEDDSGRPDVQKFWLQTVAKF